MRCLNCQGYRDFKPYMTGLYKYIDERVYVCKECGTLRTNSHKRVIESKMIYVPTQEKVSEMKNGDQE